MLETPPISRPTSLPKGNEASSGPPLVPARVAPTYPASAQPQKLRRKVRQAAAALRFTFRASGAEATLRIGAWAAAALARHAAGALGDWIRPAESRAARREARATASLEAAVRVLGSLKGAFAKVGQFAALRHDLLPSVVHLALTTLRDRVPPLPFPDIRWAVERELGAPLEQLFSSFDPTPLGAASIAQVHRAALPDGTPVAVKVQYPWLEASLPADLAIVRALVAIGALTRRGSRSGLDAGQIFREFASGLAEEVDFTREARVAEEIAANLAGDDAIVVPSIVRSHSARRVLVMSLHPTLRLEPAELDRAGVDRRAVLEALARAYAKQVFVDGLFHADPHPGNLFVVDEPEAQIRPRVLFVDFGLCKRLDPELRVAMRQAIYALLRRDCEAFVDRMDELGMIAGGARPGVRAAVETMLERISRKSGGAGVLGVAGGQVLGLKDEAKALLQDTPGLQLPTDLLLYAKTLSYLFALGDELEPNVDLLQLSTPYLLRFLAQK